MNEIERDMDFKPVTSSNVEAIAHDSETRTLHVRYKGGAVYKYVDVDSDKHAALMRATSIGKHLNEHIKGKHPHSKL